MKPLRVLSAFDGMSCGQIALERAGVQVETYFASEVCVSAIAVTQDNYPDTKQIGSIGEVVASDLGQIDLMIGGSSCQGFSFSGLLEGMVTSDKQEILTLEHYLEMKESNFEFSGYSYLFWEYVRLLREIKPTYFLLENVMMLKKWRDVISDALGVLPIEIDSASVGGQTRKRLYWSNIPEITVPIDKGILLQDLLESGSECVNFSSSGRGGGVVESRTTKATKALTLTKGGYSSRSFTGVALEDVPTDFYRQGAASKINRPITTRFTGGYSIDGIKFRDLSLVELERLQTVPDGYTWIASKTAARQMLGNGWTVDVIAHLFKGLRYLDETDGL